MRAYFKPSRPRQICRTMNETSLSVSEVLSIHSSASCDDLKEQKQVGKFILSKWYDKSTRETFVRWATEPMAPKWCLDLVCSSLLIQEPLFQKLATWEQMFNLLRYNDNLDEVTIANCAIGWYKTHKNQRRGKGSVLGEVRWHRIRFFELVDIVSRNKELFECISNKIAEEVSVSASRFDVYTHPTSEPRGIHYSWLRHAINLEDELVVGVGSPDLCPSRFTITPNEQESKSNPVVGIFNPSRKDIAPKFFTIGNYPQAVFVKWSPGQAKAPALDESSNPKSVTLFVDWKESDQYRVGCYHCDVSPLP